MIISYSRNFIFIKTHKTASSSMETALAMHCAPDDVVTPFGPTEELNRYKNHPTAHPRNFSTDPEGEKRYLEALESGKKKLIKTELKDLLGKSVVPRHGGANVAREFVGKKFWKEAYKFSIERHPYEKAVSLAWYSRGKREFNEALDEVLRDDAYRNFRLYARGGKMIVDFVIRLENLGEDIPKVEQALGGLEILSKLPFANARTRKDERSAREVLTEEQKKIVRKTCRAEFEMFGYER